MTREEIYDHLAQVYLGKKVRQQEDNRKYLDKKFILQVIVMVCILGSTFYAATAFLSRKESISHNRVVYALNHSPIRIKYNLTEPYPSVKEFSISIPSLNASKYSFLNFSLRGTEDGYPGIVKVVLKNRRNEEASYFVNDVKLKWQRVRIPMDEFKQITDWSVLTDISFILEAWNTEKKRGVMLIDDVSFSS